MAFNNNPGKQSFTASGGQTGFDFNFKIYADEDLKVYLTPEGQDPDDTTDILTLTTDYTVVIDGDDGGTITLVSGATLNDTIVIARDLDATRDISYVTNGDLKAATLNLDQDYQTYLIIDGFVALASSIQLPQSAVNVSSLLPNVVGDAYLKWNAAGTQLENDTTVPQSVIDAAASASAASTSETNAAASEAAAEAAYDDFDDRYLGAKSSDPTLDNDGDPLITGALYFNTTADLMRVYTGSAWINAYSSTAGKVLQVKTSLLGTGLATSSTSYVATGLAVTLTPQSSTSKIIIMVSNGGGTTNSSGRQLHEKCYKDGTEIISGQENIYRIDANNFFFPHSYSLVTDAIDKTARTYEMYYKAGSADTVEYNRNGQGQVQMIVMEVEQ